MADKGKYWIGFDLGGTKMLAVVLDKSFKKIGSKRIKTKAHQGMDAGIERMIKAIRAAIEDAGLSVDDISGMGVGSPGPLDLDKGVVLDLANLGWKDVPLKKTFEKEFGFPVTVINDVDAGVYGEYVMGAAQEARCVLGIFPGTGIGGGCVYEGEILHGKTSSSFEIGHMRVMPEGPLCGCGLRGCLETVASRLAISAEVAKAAYRGEAPHLIEKAGTDLSEIRSGALAYSIRSGDKVVEQIVSEAARWLGVGVASAVALMSPDVVVLGGGMVEAMPKLFAKEVGDAVKEYTMPAMYGSMKLVVSKLGDDATVVGAAAWARRAAKGE